jgi:hypothetical protein
VVVSVHHLSWKLRENIMSMALARQTGRLKDGREKNLKKKKTEKGQGQEGMGNDR